MSEEKPTGATPPALPKKPRSRLPWLVAVIVCFLIPPITFLIWYGSTHTSNASAIRALETEARKHGEPITLAELQAKYPPIPDAQNAAVALLAVWEEEDPAFWQAYLDGEAPPSGRHYPSYDPALPYLGANARRIPRTGPLPSNSLAAAEAYLKANADHLARVHAALQRPHFRFPVKIEDGPDALLPHLSQLRIEAENFEIAALLASERGDKPAAIPALHDTARSGQILAEEPIFLSQLVRRACLEITLNSVEQLLSRQSLTKEELDQLQSLLDQINLRGVARSALIDERPFSLSVFNPDVMARALRNNSSEDGTDSPEQTAHRLRIGYSALQMLGFWDRDRRLMLQTFHGAIELAGQETPESLTNFDALFEAASQEARKFPPKIFSAMLLPALQRVPLRFATFEARRRAALVALAVERYRLDHQDRIPDTLEALVPDYLPAIPSDPLDGQPIRFSKLGPGYVVYSVGEDREDDGGTEHVRGKIEHTDITFTVER